MPEVLSWVISAEITHATAVLLEIVHRINNPIMSITVRQHPWTLDTERKNMSSTPIYTYYVYQYLREDGTPYYIGKGKDRRATSRRHFVPVPKDPERIVFIETNMSEQQAFDLEVELIAQYGRKDLGTGILRNLTDGGEGSSGRTITDEFRKKCSDSNKGNRNRLGHTNSKDHNKAISSAMSGRAKDDSHKQKISNTLKGRTLSETTRKKMAEAQRLRRIRERHINTP